MRRPAAILLALALACGATAGPQAWGKLLWMAGAPGLALPLVRDEAARGAILYRLGRYEEADAAFARLGRSATYDRGLTLAALGEHRLAVAYFDAVLFANRYDAEARHNRDLVAGLVDPTVGEAMGHGRIRAILAEAGVETAAFDPLNPEAKLMLSEHDGLRASPKRPVDGERTVTAGDAWLETLADAPAAYLRSILAAEMRRRHFEGTAAPQEETRW